MAHDEFELPPASRLTRALRLDAQSPSPLVGEGLGRGGSAANSATPLPPPLSHKGRGESLPLAEVDKQSSSVSELEIATEIPISFIYDDQPCAVMMASPTDIEDFACGFSLTEGIIRAVDEIRSIEVSVLPHGLAVEIALAEGASRQHLNRRRAMAGRTSCGLCGVETLDQLPQAQKLAATSPIPARAVFAALAQLDKHQKLNALTRASHAAAFCAREGGIQAVREDVGRHNALDKLIGALLRAGIAPGDGFILITSRASFEMIEKTAIFGAATLVAISAPTSLAIERAQALGLTLAAIARADSLLVFSGALDTEEADNGAQLKAIAP